MLLEANFIEGIRQLFSYHNIVSISGKSGTGKTTLALQLVGTLIMYEEPFTDSCIWIQASEHFSLKRLTQIFQEKSKELRYIQDNIYVIPKKRPIHTYEQQVSIIEKILSPGIITPPSLKYVVIDNISHHLRYKLTQYSNPKDISSLLNIFYETQLMPLIIYCKRNEIILIMIHEVTYSPNLERIKPFFYKLYDRINTIDIFLSHIYNSEKKNLQISFKNLKWNFQFTLEHEGITIL